MKLAILQARCSSTRFPNKVISDLNGHPMIIRQLNRLEKSQFIDRIVVATSTETSDDPLVEILEKSDFEVFRGDLQNVTSRFLNLIEIYNPDVVIRLTADCPLADPLVIDQVIARHINSGAGYTSNTLQPTYPDGLDVECFKPSELVRLSSSGLSEIEKEHVTYGLYSRQNFCKLESCEQSTNLSNLRWTVDIPDDLDFVRKIYSYFPDRPEAFNQEDVMKVLKNNPELNRTNDSLERNAGLKSTGQAND